MDALVKILIGFFALFSIGIIISIIDEYIGFDLFMGIISLIGVVIGTSYIIGCFIL